MATKDKSDGSTKSAKTAARLPDERANFKSLLLANPNYFGGLKDSEFKAVKPMAGDKTYEELKCVGYNPVADLLKAVVWVKLNSGYSGTLCSGGSQEYVRFYVSFDDGTTWTDQGMVSFAAHDLPGPKPLEYAVTLQPKRYWTWCPRESLPLVRAILSWNVPPPPDSPDWPPVWGNVEDAHIQVRPRRRFFVGDLFKEAKLTLPKGYETVLDLNQEVNSPPLKALNGAELSTLYKGKDVAPHRFLFSEVQKYIAHPALTEAYKGFGSQGILGDLGIDIGAVIGVINTTDGDTSFEKLTCVGLDPNGQENLVGIFKIKRPNGYSGPQCSAGSQEYVAFWVDWEDGSGWQWAGTTQVNVHDFSTIPSDGLAYAVAQPINLAAHRKPCSSGPVTAKVRAILSWNTPPPSWNPDYRPTWGNHVDTRVHIYPGPTVQVGNYTPYLEGLCGVATCSIDQTTGFAPGERPFGGSISIYGNIPGAPDRSTSAANRPRYRITVTELSTSLTQPLTDPFSVTINEQVGSAMPTSSPATQSVGANNFYTYQDAPNVPGIGWRFLFPAHLLGVWNTSGKTGLWRIEVEALDPFTNTPYVAGTMLCTADGTLRQSVVLDLDNKAPVAMLSITEVSHDNGVTWGMAGDCGTFVVGDLIRGTYSVTDEHFGSLSLSLQPSVHTNGASTNGFTIHGVPNITSRAFPTVPTGGESGLWILNTAGMDPCGYTIQLLTNDRTIVSCSGTWQNNGEFVGFCLKAKTP